MHKTVDRTLNRIAEKQATTEKRERERKFFKLHSMFIDSGLDGSGSFFLSLSQ